MPKTVLVTGGSGAIGSAIAKTFAEQKYNLALQYKSNKESALEVANECAKNALVLPVYCDLSSPKSIKNMMQEIKSFLGGVDILVYSAGIAHIELLTFESDEKIAEIISTNLLGAIYTAKACIPYMLDKGCGKIINISSMWGQVGASCESVYSASKGGLDSFTKALAKELGPSGITVNAVSPGLIDTKMNEHIDKAVIDELIEETPIGKIGTPQDVANAVLFLASEKADFITGEILKVNGGLSI